VELEQARLKIVEAEGR
jgi:hypothetical protein